MFLHHQVVAQRLKLSDVLRARIDYTQTNNVLWIDTILVFISYQRTLKKTFCVESVRYDGRAVLVNPHAHRLASNRQLFWYEVVLVHFMNVKTKIV